MSLFRSFPNGIVAEVRCTLQQIGSGVLSVDQCTGVINTLGLRFSGFKVTVFVPETIPVLVTMKNISRQGGAYHDDNVARINIARSGDIAYSMVNPIQVMRVGSDVWTRWHPDPKGGPDQTSNRLDCWILGLDGSIRLFQVGVVTHDNGQTFRLLGERIWEGQLFQTSTGELVTKSDGAQWGAFTDSRRHVFNHPDFKAWLKMVSLDVRDDVPPDTAQLGPLPSQNGHPGDYARIQWYTPFAGQKGQGIAILRDGSSAWIHGAEVHAEPDADGIRRLHCNDLLRYEGVDANWGSKQGKPPKLTGVTLVPAEV